MEDLIRNEEGKIKLMFIEGGYQLFPDNEELPYIYITDEELGKIITGDYKLANNSLVYEPDYLLKYRLLNYEMKKNDWKQLRAYRHLMLDGSITEEDREILQWFKDKAIELESCRNKLEG